ncbi:hypothetical protein RQ831_09680, partial [Roseomonas gilardii]|nr:hypothetical protein [Roseomonas gilardii]
MTAGARRHGAGSPAPAFGLLLLALLLAMAAPGLSRPALAQNAATAPQSSAAQPSAAQPGLTPEEARRALEVLQNDARRRDVITTLEAIARTAPASTPATPSTHGAPVPGGATAPAAGGTA